MRVFLTLKFMCVYIENEDLKRKGILLAGIVGSIIFRCQEAALKDQETSY